MQNNILNITTNTFGGNLKKGDLLASLYILEYYRNQFNNPNLKFFYAHELDMELDFFNYIKSHCDYVSDVSGTRDLPYHGNMWLWKDYLDVNFRLKIKLDVITTNQPYVIINPVFDAKYNTYRNWPDGKLYSLIQNLHAKNQDYKVISRHNIKFIPHHKIIQGDITKSIEAINNCQYYIGGETGLTLYASIVKDLIMLVQYDSATHEINSLEECYKHYPVYQHGRYNVRPFPHS